MTETIERKVCDVCKKEVNNFAGSLELKYSGRDYTGCGFPVEITRKDICINCCRKLDKYIMDVLHGLEIEG